MKSRAMGLVVVGVFCGAMVCFAAGEAVSVALDFEKDAVGSVPDGWKIETVNAEEPGTPVATWGVVEDPKAPSGKHIFSLTKVNHDVARAFNLCWTDRVRAKDVSLKVSLRSDDGFEDQGGGLMWRVQDANNYYLCRYNPLESNLRLYVVKDGKRIKIGDAIALIVPTDTWATIEVNHTGDRIVCKLDGKQVLDVDFTRVTIGEAGGIGLWTKGDAVTSFDSLEVKGN
ncbi:MAG: family 16 glycoside hydrolase [Candidatus Hydrogenedentales bacterium]